MAALTGSGLLELREVPGARDLHEARARDRLGEEPRIPGRRQAILRARHHERRDPDPGQPVADVEPVAGEIVAERHQGRPFAQDARHHRRALRRRRGAEREVLDEALALARVAAQELDEPGQHAEPRAGADQDEAGQARGPQERQSLRDRAAHRVPDEDRRLPGHPGEESVQPLRVCRDAGPAPAAERPMPREVGRDDLRHVGERVELPLPELRGSARAMHQDERGARPGFEPRRRLPGDGPGAPGRPRHRTAPRAVIGQSASTRPPRTATYQS